MSVSEFSNYALKRFYPLALMMVREIDYSHIRSRSILISEPPLIIVAETHKTLTEVTHLGAIGRAMST